MGVSAASAHAVSDTLRRRSFCPGLADRNMSAVLRELRDKCRQAQARRGENGVKLGRRSSEAASFNKPVKFARRLRRAGTDARTRGRAHAELGGIAQHVGRGTRCDLNQRIAAGVALSLTLTNRPRLSSCAASSPRRSSACRQC